MTENDFKINFLKIPKSVITDSIHFYFNYEEIGEAIKGGGGIR